VTRTHVVRMFKSLLPWKHTKTKVMVPEQTMEDDNILQEQRLLPCNTCGRTFFPLPLKKHVPICEKNSVKKRKIFDSLKQRVEGTDLAQFHQKTYLKRQESIPKAVEPKPKKPSQWEENHKKLVDAIRSAKGTFMCHCRRKITLRQELLETCLRARSRNRWRRRTSVVPFARDNSATKPSTDTWSGARSTGRASRSLQLTCF
jgi:hypothetical protein